MSEELAWAAGFFEGEGTVRIGGPRPSRGALGYVEVSVVNTDAESVQFFQARWPGYVKPLRAIGNRKQAWRWTRQSRQATEVLMDLLPYLRTAHVRAKVLLALDFQEQKRIGGGRRPVEYVAEQWRFHDVMRELNARGRR